MAINTIITVTPGYSLFHRSMNNGINFVYFGLLLHAVTTCVSFIAVECVVFFRFCDTSQSDNSLRSQYHYALFADMRVYLS